MAFYADGGLDLRERALQPSDAPHATINAPYPNLGWAVQQPIEPEPGPGGDGGTPAVVQFS